MVNGAIPFELDAVLHARDPATGEAAWEGLVARHTKLLLAVARSLGGDRDEAMERYSYILEKLRENDFRRLRAFQADGRARFSTWLTVASRRLCLDHHRTRYGRSRPDRDSEEAVPLRALRRRLVDSVSSGLDTDLLPDAGTLPADAAAFQAERDQRLRAAVETLPASDRLLLTLRFENDLSAARIASILEFTTPFHVYRRLNGVLRQLRVILRAHGIEGVDG